MYFVRGNAVYTQIYTMLDAPEILDNFLKKATQYCPWLAISVQLNAYSKTL